MYLKCPNCGWTAIKLKQTNKYQCPWCRFTGTFKKFIKIF